jgi:hypothetical protein
MTTSKLIEQLHIELTAIHGQVHPDVTATITAIGDRLDLLEKTSLVLLAAYRAKNQEHFQTALRILEVTMLPPPDLPEAPAKEAT